MSMTISEEREDSPSESGHEKVLSTNLVDDEGSEEESGESEDTKKEIPEHVEERSGSSSASPSSLAQNGPRGTHHSMVFRRVGLGMTEAMMTPEKTPLGNWRKREVSCVHARKT
jgi:hypothetical protein